MRVSIIAPVHAPIRKAGVVDEHHSLILPTMRQLPHSVVEQCTPLKPFLYPVL